MSRPPLRYRLASLGLALPLAGYTLVRTARDGGCAYLCGRYGYTGTPRGLGPLRIRGGSRGRGTVAA